MGWNGGRDSRFIRWQLVTGVVLVAAGVCARVWSDIVTSNVVDFLGPTGQVGSEVANLLLTVLYQLAAPVGVALVAVVPLQAALRDRSTSNADARSV